MTHSVNLKPTTFLISQLANELTIERKRHPELFLPCNIYEEDPGMNYKFRVEHELSKYVKKKDPDKDQKLYQDMYASLLFSRKRKRKLPIDAKETEIIESVKNHQATMIIGGTGSGKSTRVPQFILEEEIRSHRGSECQIICTQPRRVAATSIARRVAFELGEQVGKSVGYAIRGDSVKCERNNATIFYCTTGVLVRRLTDNPALVGVSHVILDEIHEDSIDLDLVIWFLKELVKIRPDFKLILMSATMDGKSYQKYLEYCPIIKVDGTNFPVEEHFLEDMAPFIGSTVGVGDMQSDAKFFVIRRLVEYIVKSEPPGAILIFVPGWYEMEKLQESLNDYNYNQTRPEYQIKIRLLHSRVALEDRKIFDPIKGSGRKVLISTTIAESSITVSDVVYVIDTGTHVMPFFDQYHQSRVFKTEYITKASAAQRLGRAGRVQPGTCFRLYTRSQFAQFSEYRGINKSSNNVSSAILNVLSLGETTEVFKSFVHPPNSAEVAHELKLLKTYNMIGANDRLTFLGIRVNHMPSDPLIAKFAIISSLFGCGDEAAVITAGLSISTLFPMPLAHKAMKQKKKKSRHAQVPHRSDLTIALTGTTTSDGLAILETLRKYTEADDKNGFCDTYYLFEKSLEGVLALSEVIKQEMAALKGVPQRKMANSCFRSILAAAFLPNLAFTKYTPKTKSAKFYVKGTTGFSNAQLDSVLARKNVTVGELYTFNESTGIPPKINLSFLNQISPEALFLFAEDMVKQSSTKVLVNNYIVIEGDESKVTFLHSLRSGFLNVFSNALKTPKTIDWKNDASGRIIDIVIRLLSE